MEFLALDLAWRHTGWHWGNSHTYEINIRKKDASSFPVVYAVEIPLYLSEKFEPGSALPE